MKRKLRLAAIVVLALVFAGSMTVVLLRVLDYRGGAKDYGEAEALVGLPELDLASLSGISVEWPFPPGTGEPAPSAEGSGGSEASAAPERPRLTQEEYEQALKGLDLSALRGVNSDVTAWIVIPDTMVSYPVVRGSDNQYYLDHTWKGIQRSVGAIFMDYHSSADFSDFNTIIYGHRMSDSSMFHTLLSYGREGFWSSHPVVYIAGDGVCRRYRVFSAYEASVTGKTYTLGFQGEGDRQEFLDFCLAQSDISTGIAPTVDGQILTLSTCTSLGSSDKRWVVHAVLEQVI